MKKTKIFVLLSLFALVAISVNGNGTIDKQTYIFAVKGSDSLRLDKYEMSSGLNAETEAQKELKPCVVFMFGGGFFSGSRDDKIYIPYFEFLTRNGYVVVSIDYRLGLSSIAKQNDGNPLKFMLAFANSIEMAVEDLFEATSYVVDNAQQWGVDPKMIIANGSSAGAISVLQGEYEISNGSMLTKKLPKGFNYAGVVSFAGAVLVIGEFSYSEKPCPIMFFHGDADSNVPYDKLTEAGMGLYGSKHISGYMDARDLPYWLWVENDAAHEIANTPMDNNRQEIISFIDKLVKDRQPLKIRSDTRRIGKPTVKKEFTIIDYIKANFGQ